MASSLSVLPDVLPDLGVSPASHPILSGAPAGVLYSYNPDTNRSYVFMSYPLQSSVLTPGFGDIRIGPGLGGFWGSIGGFFSWLGKGIWKGVQTVGSWVTRNYEVMPSAIKSGDGCIYDQLCNAHYILAPGSTENQYGYRQASQGECVGKQIIAAETVSGWISPCDPKLNPQTPPPNKFSAAATPFGAGLGSDAMWWLVGGALILGAFVVYRKR